MKYKIYSSTEEGFTNDIIAVLLDFKAERKTETFGNLDKKEVYEGFYYEIQFESIHDFNEFARIMMQQFGCMLLLIYNSDESININLCNSVSLG